MSSKNQNKKKNTKRKTTMKRWDDIDDGVLIRNIQKYPTNLGLAFRESAVELGRSESSTSQRWYNTLKHSETIIATGSDRGLASNTKVTVFKEDDDTNTRKNMLIAMFGSMDPTIVVEAFLDMLSMDEQKSLFKRAAAKLAV